ncbi:uncharacterized protein WCC33_008006 [Rhinophrynus dorsalis]
MDSPKNSRLARIPKVKVIIRLCDAFTRTDGNVICPIIKAEDSIRVLYKLQGKLFKDLINEVEVKFGMTDQDIQWKSSCGRPSEGNLFVTYMVPHHFHEDQLNRFREMLTSKLMEKSKVQRILIDKVENTDEIIPQPLISEIDFEIQKLELCYKELFEMPVEPEIKNAIDVTAENVKECLDELKEHHTKIAVLSHNGRGKSYFLNLLLRMTSDNEEEYRENNRNLILPKDVTGNPSVEEIKQLKKVFINLPDVNRYELVRKVTMTEVVQQKMLLCLPMPGPKCKKLMLRKTVERSYESTTKCIIHLRYGSVYQLKVEYFEVEELQTQLFELVSLNRKEAGDRPGINKDIKNKSRECLKARFEVLTDYGISTTNENGSVAPGAFVVQEYGEAGLDGMALEVIILKKEGFSDVISAMIQARKLVSSKAYHRVWSIFHGWCAYKNMPTQVFDLSLVPSFLRDGVKKGLSLSSLKDFLQTFHSYEDIILSEEVKKFAGKVELYIGQGNQSTADRLALQFILRNLTSFQNKVSCETKRWKLRMAAVKEIVVYVPSKILYGGKEILEMPGTDDSDPLAMDFIEKALNEVEGIILMSEYSFNIGEKEVKKILLNSEFMKAWKNTPEHYALMFLGYPEKNSDFHFGKDDKGEIKTLENIKREKRSIELKDLSRLIEMLPPCISNEFKLHKSDF